MTTSTFIKSWWPIIIVAGSGVAAFSTLAADLSNTKEKVEAQVSDHDRIVRMETKQDRMADDVKEMKQDIKDIAKAVK